MNWQTMTPDQAFNHYRLFGPGGPYENEYDETGLMRALELGDPQALTLVNQGQSQRVSENITQRTIDPLAYDVDIIMADMVSGYKTTFEAGAALRALQAQYGASQNQMLDAMSKSPVRSGATREQNLNVLMQAMPVEAPRIVADAGATKPPLAPGDVKTGITTPAIEKKTVTIMTTSATVSDADIKQFIDDTLNGPGTDKQKAQAIIAAMRQYNVSVQRIVQATGYTLSQVNQYLALATSTPTPTPTPVTASNVLPLALAAVAFYLLG